MKQLVDVFDEVIPRYQTWIARARALDVPAGERAFLDRYVGTLDEQLALIKAGRDALDERDFAAADTFSERGRRVSDRRQALVAGHDGFRYCGAD